jgi:hypothetical protein
LLLEETTGDEVRIIKLYRANLADGSTIAEIDINESRGKLYNDDNPYGAKYHPLFSAEL